MLLAGLWVVVSVFALLRRRLGAVGLAVGMLVLLALAGVLLAVTVPGLSGAVVQPTLVVIIGAVVAALLPRASSGRPHRGLPDRPGRCSDPARTRDLDRVRPRARDRTAQCGTARRCSSRWRFPWSSPPGRGRPARGRERKRTGGRAPALLLVADRRPHRRRSGGQPRRRHRSPPGADRVLGRRRHAGRVLGLERTCQRATGADHC